MVNLSKITGFEWDKWNVDKSYSKHGITPNETEDVLVKTKLFPARHWVILLNIPWIRLRMNTIHR